MDQTLKALTVVNIVEVSLMERYVGMMPCVHPMPVFKTFVNQTRVPFWKVATWIVTVTTKPVASPITPWKLPRFAVQVVLLLGKVKGQMGPLSPRTTVVRLRPEIPVEMIPCALLEHVPLRAGP